MAADLPDPPPVWRMQTAHTYLTNHRGPNRGQGPVICVVASKLEKGALITTVADGPLNGQGETVTTGPDQATFTPAALRNQHNKWVWRVVNADLTHREWFQARRRRNLLKP